VARAPGEFVERFLEPRNLGDVAHAHGPVVHLRDGDRAHRFAWRLSSLVRATLSRKYRGAARSAVTVSPRAKRRAATRATAPARGRSPSRRIAIGSRYASRSHACASKPLPVAVQLRPGSVGAPPASTSRGAITSSQ